MQEKRITWSLQIMASFPGNVSRGYCVMQDMDCEPKFEDPVTNDLRNYRFVDSNRADFSAFKVFESYRNFLETLGFTVGPYRDVDITGYTFRFSALTTNGAINVIGCNDDLSPILVSNNQVEAIAALRTDQDFVDLFTQIAGWL